MATEPGRPLRDVPGAGRRRRALDGRRAGDRLARALDASAHTLARAASGRRDGGRCRILVALAGTAAVLAVQTRANRDLKLANIDLAIANSKVTKANVDLAASNQRERARVALAQEAIRTFHTGVSEDILLKQEEFEATA